MAQRIYFSKLSGDGIGAPFRPLVNNYVGTWTAVDARSNILAQAGWMLVKCDPTPTEHAAIIADPDIKYLKLENAAGDNLPLTSLLSEVNGLSVIKTFLESHHIPTDGLTGSDTIKHALKVIVKRFVVRQFLRGNDFSESLDLTVGDISAQKRQNLAARLVELGIDTSGITQATSIRDALKSILDQNVKWLKSEYDD